MNAPSLQSMEGHLQTSRQRQRVDNNNYGENLESCGTPVVTIQESHHAVVRGSCDLLIPDNMPLSQTVSNAADKSIATQTVRPRLGVSST